MNDPLARFGVRLDREADPPDEPADLADVLAATRRSDDFDAPAGTVTIRGTEPTVTNGTPTVTNGRPADREPRIVTRWIDRPDEPPRDPIERLLFSQLREKYPTLNPPVVGGLFRAGEVINIVSTSKVGKSWLLYDLLLSIITGEPWLGIFETAPGPCALIDNELHKPSLAHRIRTVAEAKSLTPHQYEHSLEVWPLRGDLRSLHEVGRELLNTEPGTFRAIAFDAKYRFAMPGRSENDNAAEAEVYNLLDRFAAHTGAALPLIHHASKGDQSGKQIVDVGSGAGSQSRAADCHLILREHEEPDCVVLDGVVRSFAPIRPIVLRWSFPVWRPQDHLDPALLKGRKSPREQYQSDRDKAGIDKLVDALRKGPGTVRDLRGRTGLSREVCNRLLDVLEAGEHVTFAEISKRGNPTREYRLSDVGD